MNQHFVPKVYLKNFSIKRKNEYFIDVYDKFENRFFQTNTKNICAIKNLYTFSENSDYANTPLGIENLYSNYIEPFYQRAYNILTNDNIIYINERERIEIILGVLQLYFRNPKVFGDLVLIHRENLKKNLKIAKTQGLKKIKFLGIYYDAVNISIEDNLSYFDQKTNDIFKEEHIVGFKQLSVSQSNLKIHVLKLMDNFKYFTSDNPLIIKDVILPQNENPYVNTKQFYLTLNPYYAVYLYHDKGKNSNKIHRESVSNGSSFILNDQIINNSERFVLGVKKDEIEGHNKEVNFFQNESLELKIDLIKQIYGKFPIDEKNKKMMAFLKTFIDLYNEQGTLNNHQEYQLHMGVKKLNAVHYRKKI